MNISVYITSYNQKVYLQEAIDSILEQTLPAGQIIIVDDNSSDGSQELIAGYHARYSDLITPIFHDQNRGVVQARLTALQAVRGEFVTYLDGDDRFLPGKLEQEAACLLKNPRAQIAFSNHYYITAGGQRYATWITDKKPPQGDVFLEVLTRRYPRRNLFRMELLPYALWKEVGFHDPALDVLEDWEMRIRLSRKYQVAYWDEPLAEVRVHKAGLSNMAVEKKLRAFDYIWNKHEALLSGFSPQERENIKKDRNRLRAMFLRQQAKELLGAYDQTPHGGKELAWDYYKESWAYHRYLDLDLLLGLALPPGVYLPLRNSMRRYFGKGDGRFNQPMDY